MYLVGESRILKALKTATLTGNPGIVQFRRGSLSGKILIEPYKDIVGITMSVYWRTIPDVIEENYVDVEKCANIYNTLENIQEELNNLYNMCQIGLYVKYSVWENPLPKNITMEDIQRYFNISDKEVERAIKKYYRYSKDMIILKGTYYGEKRITLIQSKRTKLIDKILAIEDIKEEV